MPATNGPAHAGKMIVSKIYTSENPRAPARLFDKAARRYYKIWPDMLNELNIEEGGTYAVTFTTDEYEGKTQYMLTGAQPVGRANPSAKPVPITDSSDREINIPVQAIVKGNPELALALANGDVRKATQILRTARQAWLEYLKPVPSQPKEPPANAPADYDDEIPY